MRRAWWYLRCFASAIRYRDLDFARDAIAAIRHDRPPRTLRARITPS